VPQTGCPQALSLPAFGTKQHVQPFNPPSSISAQLLRVATSAINYTNDCHPEPPKMSIPEVPAAGLAIPNFFEKPEPLKRPPSATHLRPDPRSLILLQTFLRRARRHQHWCHLHDNSSVPNFFANSVAVNKPISVTPPQLNAFTHAHATLLRMRRIPFGKVRRLKSLQLLSQRPRHCVGQRSQAEFVFRSSPTEPMKLPSSLLAQGQATQLQYLRLPRQPFPSKMSR